MKTIKLLALAFLLSCAGTGIEASATNTTKPNTTINQAPKKKKTTKKTAKKSAKKKKGLGRCHCDACGNGQCRRQATVRHGGWRLCSKCNHGPYGSGCFYYCDSDCGC